MQLTVYIHQQTLAGSIFNSFLESDHFTSSTAASPVPALTPSVCSQQSLFKNKSITAFLC